MAETTTPFEGAERFFEILFGSTTVEFIDSLLGLNQSFSLSGSQIDIGGEAGGSAVAGGFDFRVGSFFAASDVSTNV